MNTPESNELVPAPPAPDFSDAKTREQLRAQLRAEEWALHQELMSAGRTMLKILLENPHKSTVADLSRIIDLADKLGRLATASDHDVIPTETETTTVMIEFKAALQRVFSRREAENRPLASGAVLDVESTATKPDPQP